MFETIGTILTIALWAVSIFVFLGGIIACIATLSDDCETGWAKFLTIVGIVLGIYIFYRVYVWFESIVWCLFASGAILGIFAAPGSFAEQSKPKEKEYTFTEALIDSYVEQEVIKNAVKDAIREELKN